MIATLFALLSLSNPYGGTGCGLCCKDNASIAGCMCNTCGPDYIEPKQPDCAQECRRTIQDTGERVCNLPCAQAKAEMEEPPPPTSPVTVMIVTEQNKKTVYDVSTETRKKWALEELFRKCRTVCSIEIVRVEKN